MARLYKLLGMIIAVVGIVAGYLAASSIDVGSAAGGADFFSAMLNSEAVVNALARARLTVGGSIAGIGICLGIITFGIGGILQRIDKLRIESTGRSTE